MKSQMFPSDRRLLRELEKVIAAQEDAEALYVDAYGNEQFVHLVDMPRTQPVRWLPSTTPTAPAGICARLNWAPTSRCMR